MDESRPPLSLRFDLAAVPDSGTEKRLDPSAETRAAIAAWAGVVSLDRLHADIRLSRLGPDTYSYDAHFEADVVQECVVTLEPVRSHIARDIQRRFRIQALPRKRKIVPIEPLSDDDEVELLPGSAIDLAAPVLEELSLNLNPYPRAPGASFAVPVEDEPPKKSPFAVLEDFKPLLRKPDAKRR